MIHAAIVGIGRGGLRVRKGKASDRVAATGSRVVWCRASRIGGNWRVRREDSLGKRPGVGLQGRQRRTGGFEIVGRSDPLK